MADIRYVLRERVSQDERDYDEILADAKSRASETDTVLVKIINDLFNNSWILDVEKSVM